jgi:hypothetical protein
MGKKTATKEKVDKPKLPQYREVSPEEVEMLFAFYEKYGGNINQMALDKDIPFKSYNQLHHYCRKHEFKGKLVEVRLKRAKFVVENLHNAKNRAVERAMQLLESYNVFVYNKFGTQVFDKEGNPLIIEKLPYYKEIKAAWEIIKAELGEPTSIGKTDITSDGKPLMISISKEIAEKNNVPTQSTGRDSTG